MSTKSLCTWLVLAALPCAWAGAAYAEGKAFVVVQQKVNPVMKPKGPVDVINDCAKNPTCKGMVEAAAVYLGAEPGEVSGAMAAVPQAAMSGEEGHFTLALPAGYQYCRSKIQTVSVTPAEGDRASVMSATSNKNGVAIYTWTPKQGMGGGKSWVDADYTIYGVRDDVADKYRANGKCKAYGKPLIACRGAKGVNKGQPACGTVEG